LSTIPEVILVDQIANETSDGNRRQMCSGNMSMLFNSVEDAEADVVRSDDEGLDACTEATL
jgi:hypothetical protein